VSRVIKNDCCGHSVAYRDINDRSIAAAVKRSRRVKWAKHHQTFSIFNGRRQIYLSNKSLSDIFYF
jgi:hypothetical protein